MTEHFVSTLGTGTFLTSKFEKPRRRRSLHANYAQFEEINALFDCSAETRTLARDHGIDLLGVGAVALTHAHVDHAGGLLSFLQERVIVANANGRTDLDIYGPSIIDYIANDSYPRFNNGIKLNDGSLQVKTHVFEPGRMYTLADGHVLTPYRVEHKGLPDAYALAADIEGYGRVAFSGDCRDGDGVRNAAKHARLFVCNVGGGLDSDPQNSPEHLTVGDAILIAASQEVERIALTHFSGKDSRDHIEEHARNVAATLRYPGEIIVAKQGMKFPLKY